MSPQTDKGFRFEKEVATGLNNKLPPSCKVYPCGWSGNAGYPLPDILVTTPQWNHAIELKNSSQEKGFVIEEDDIIQMNKCESEHSKTRSWVGVKFSHRELCVFALPTTIDYDTIGVDDDDGIMDVIMKTVAEAVPLALNPRIGHTSNSLLLDKPSLDEWPSSRSGRSDVSVLVDALGVGSKEQFDIDSTQEAEA